MVIPVGIVESRLRSALLRDPELFRIKSLLELTLFRLKIDGGFIIHNVPLSGIAAAGDQKKAAYEQGQLFEEY